MNLHLVEISRHVTAGAHAVLLLDRAGWHRLGGQLHLPHNISLLHLPPYSPELNPVENIWQFLRQNFLSNRVYDSYDAIVAASAQHGMLSSLCLNASSQSRSEVGLQRSTHRADGLRALPHIGARSGTPS